MSNLNMIKTICEPLDNFLNKIVFVGGSVAELYVNDEAASKPRATDDVDIVIAAVNYSEFTKFEEEIRKLGFTNVIDGPSCRYKYKDVLVDFISTEQSAAGFTNRWYPDGFSRKIQTDKTSPPVFIFYPEGPFFSRRAGFGMDSG